MPRLAHLPELGRNSMLSFPCELNDDAPWTIPARPLRAARVALVTSAGLHLRADQPFVSDHRVPDQSYRRLPSSAPATEIVQSHTSIGFDRAGIQQDLNVTYPVDRLRELEQAGRIGSLADTFYSFMGALRRWDLLKSETGPEVAGLMQAEGVDVVLLSPT
jgi:D-proline reductase (dithiol) PrdB